jgi:hypothetical protein
MIKTLGFGRRSTSMSHAACVKHHREEHSKLGLNLTEHFGKYVLYYFDAAVSGNGTVLTDLPWDMVALEWFLEDARWYNFQKWLTDAADGQVVRADEEQFLDRDQCFMFACDENVIVNNAANSDDVNIIRVLKLQSGSVAQHKSTLAPLITSTFGPSLKTYAVYDVTEATCLARGPIDTSPMDIIEVYKLDKTFMNGFENISAPFLSTRITECEADILDRQRTVIFRGAEAIYI